MKPPFIMKYFTDTNAKAATKITDPEKLIASMPTKELESQTVAFEEMTANLKGEGSFVALAISAVTDSKESAEEAGKREFQLKDYLIRELSTTTSDQLKNQKFVDSFLKKAQDHLNQQLEEGKILKLYLTKKVVQ